MTRVAGCTRWSVSVLDRRDAGALDGYRAAVQNAAILVHGDDRAGS